MDDPLIVLLAGFRLFHGLTSEQLLDVRNSGVVQEYEPGSYIVRQGDPATSIYLMFCGNAKLTHITQDGRQALHRIVRPGNGYGVATVIENSEFSWSVQAINHCCVLIWSGEVMIEFMHRYPDIVFNVLKLVIGRRRELEERYMELLTMSVEQRLARALLRLCTDVGRHAAEGCIIDIALSRSDLAEYTGTTVYSVSRLLQKWERRNWVRTRRDRLMILDHKPLEALGKPVDS